MSAAETQYSDADRARLATQRGDVMLGPAERARCEHGRLYSYRWTWSVDAGPEDGDAEYISQACNKCNPNTARATRIAKALQASRGTVAAMLPADINAGTSTRGRRRSADTRTGDRHLSPGRRIRFPEDVDAALKRRAEAAGTNVHALVIAIVRAALEKP